MYTVHFLCLVLAASCGMCVGLHDISPAPAVCPGVYSPDPCPELACTPGRLQPFRRLLNRLLELLDQLEQTSKDLKSRFLEYFPEEQFISQLNTQKIDGLQSFENFRANPAAHLSSMKYETYWSLYQALQEYIYRLRDTEWQENMMDFHGPLHPRRKAKTYQLEARRIQLISCNLLCLLAKGAPKILDDRTVDIPDKLVEEKEWNPVEKSKRTAEAEAYITLNNLETDFTHFMRTFVRNALQHKKRIR